MMINIKKILFILCQYKVATILIFQFPSISFFIVMIVFSYEYNHKFKLKYTFKDIMKHLIKTVLIILFIIYLHYEEQF